MRAELKLLSLNEPLARLWLFLLAPALVKHIFTVVWLVRAALACGRVGTAAEVKCTSLAFYLSITKDSSHIAAFSQMKWNEFQSTEGVETGKNK